jgi:uncharacterized membrane protein YccC
MVWPTNVKDWTEVVKNVLEVVGLLAGLWAIVRWRTERRDRSMDVFLRLEDQFNTDDLRKARVLLEDRYSQVSHLLERVSSKSEQSSNKELNDAEIATLAFLDSLLRFYLLLYAMRKTRQMTDDFLRPAYAYWLELSFKDDRKELRKYIDCWFPTLSQWLTSDQAEEADKRFFQPERVGKNRG